MTAVADGMAAVANGMAAVADGLKTRGSHGVILITREAANGKIGKILRNRMFRLIKRSIISGILSPVLVLTRLTKKGSVCCIRLIQSPTS